MSRLVIGSRAALIAALRTQVAERGGAAANAAAAALAEEARALAEELFLDALFLVAQFPGGQIPEAEKCCYAYDVRLCAGLCKVTWAEEAFWCGLVRVRAGPAKRTRLMHAAFHGDAARVAWLLARGAPREAADSSGWTALYFASWDGRTDAVLALLAAGANANAASYNGGTPLWISAFFGHTDVERVLVAMGAGVDVAANWDCFRTLGSARFQGHVAATLARVPPWNVDGGVEGTAVAALDNDSPRIPGYPQTTAMRAASMRALHDMRRILP